MSSYMCVGGGRVLVDPFWLVESAVVIEDIAKSLSRQCRFLGHTRRPYTVAEHSLLVSRQFDCPDLAMWGLLHDAAETYLGDWPTPIKRHVMFDLGWPGYVGGMVPFHDVEMTILSRVANRFGLSQTRPMEIPPAVRQADDRALMTERRDLFYRDSPAWPDAPDARPLDPRIGSFWKTQSTPDLEQEFLARFEELRSLRGA